MMFTSLRPRRSSVTIPWIPPSSAQPKRAELTPIELAWKTFAHDLVTATRKMQAMRSRQGETVSFKVNGLEISYRQMDVDPSPYSELGCADYVVLTLKGKRLFRLYDPEHALALIGQADPEVARRATEWRAERECDHIAVLAALDGRLDDLTALWKLVGSTYGNYLRRQTEAQCRAEDQRAEQLERAARVARAMV